MLEHQLHFEKIFYQDKKTGYWISTTSPRIRAHVWVWQNHHCKVPKGYHIHHKDENKSNNDIDNLILMDASSHARMHMQDPERKRIASEHARKNQHFTKEWHASEEGLAWHKFHGIKCWDERKPIIIICKECGTQADTKTYHQEYCSNKCKSKARRSSGIDDVKKNCIICCKEFMVNKYKKTTSCSRKCANKVNINI